MIISHTAKAGTRNMRVPALVCAGMDVTKEPSAGQGAVMVTSASAKGSPVMPTIISWDWTSVCCTE